VTTQLYESEKAAFAIQALVPLTYACQDARRYAFFSNMDRQEEDNIPCTAWSRFILTEPTNVRTLVISVTVMVALMESTTDAEKIA
jgi:hypothetical protein